MITLGIEIEQHCRIFRHGREEGPKGAHGVKPEEHVLLIQERRPPHTFCRLEVKWLCQNSVIRSNSGQLEVNRTRYHQPFNSRPSCLRASRKAFRSCAL
jgi:hypothetical protein